MSTAARPLRVPALSVALMLLISACNGDASTTTEPVANTVLSTTSTTTEPLATSTTEPPTTTTTASSTQWTIETGAGTRVRGLHIGGNWSRNSENISNPPDEWFDWLRDMNANWVGISIGLHVSDPGDSTVSRELAFTDRELSGLIGRLRAHGFNVYLTLAFEQTFGWQQSPRSELGDPTAVRMVDFAPSDWSYSEWRWNPDHPEHDEYVAEFFRTYTEQAVHFAELAEREGVALFSLGTETESLFNVVADPRTGAEYRDELLAMVEAVRAVYNGSLTYDQSHGVLNAYDEEWAENLKDRDQLWEVLDLDVIGLSWWMPPVRDEAFDLYMDGKTETFTFDVLDYTVLEQAWRRIFDFHLSALANRHPDLPIMFLEFGYTNSIRAPYQPNIDTEVPLVIEDGDGDGLDDGNQTQANAFQAFFQVASEYPGVVDGVFLWDHAIADERDAALGISDARVLTTRNQPSESVVSQAFNAWRERD